MRNGALNVAAEDSDYCRTMCRPRETIFTLL